MSFKAHRRPEHSGRQSSSRTGRRGRHTPAPLTPGPMDRALRAGAASPSTAPTDAARSAPGSADTVSDGPLVGRWEIGAAGRLVMVWSRQAPALAAPPIWLAGGDAAGAQRLSRI